VYILEEYMVQSVIERFAHLPDALERSVRSRIGRSKCLERLPVRFIVDYFQESFVAVEQLISPIDCGTSYFSIDLARMSRGVSLR
jgi:hypothetical protein